MDDTSGIFGAVSKDRYSTSPNHSSSPRVPQGYARGLGFAAENCLGIQSHVMPQRYTQFPTGSAESPMHKEAHSWVPLQGLCTHSSLLLEHRPIAPCCLLLVLKCLLKFHFFRGAFPDYCFWSNPPLTNTPLALRPPPQRAPAWNDPASALMPASD